MNQYPGTNFHDLNLDWLLSEMKNCLAEWASTKEDWEELQTSNTDFKEFMTGQWEGFRDFVLNYLHNLPLTEEVSAKIDAMVEDGTLLNLITADEGDGSALSDVAGQWLNAHITQETGYVIDDTLTVTGAAADAKAAGDAINDLKSAFITEQQFINKDSVEHGKYWNAQGQDATNENWKRYPKFELQPGTYYITATNYNATWNRAFTGVIINDVVTLLYQLDTYVMGSVYDTFTITNPATVFISMEESYTGIVMLWSGKYNTTYKYGINAYIEPTQVIDSGLYKMNYLYVATTGNDSTGDGSYSNPFASIFHANETITDNSETNRYTIIAKAGTYTDLQTKYAGQHSGQYEGVICKDYVYYESENIYKPDETIIAWDGSTGYAGDTVTFEEIQDKSPFHVRGSSYHTHIKGFTFNVSNLRYPFHVETWDATKPVEYLVENCIFNYGGNPKERPQLERPIIGTGVACYLKGRFVNCKFNRTGTTNIDNMLYQSHDETTNLQGRSTFAVGEDVTFENCSMSVANGAESMKLNPRIGTYQSKYDVLPVCKMINCSGMPVSFVFGTNSYNQKYATVLLATENIVNVSH